MLFKHLGYVCAAVATFLLPAGATYSQRLTAEGTIQRIHAAPAVSSQGEGTSRLTWRISSPGAAAIRLHFEDFALPPGARLVLRNAQGDTLRGPYTGAGPLEEGSFWSLPVAGDEVWVDLELPAGAPYAAPRITELGRMEAADGREWRDAPAPERGETRLGEFRGRTLEFEVRDGLAVFEGDMVLGRAEEIPAGPGKDQRRAAVGIDGAAYRWPGGRIPYTIDPALPNPQRVLDAVAHWNQQLGGAITLTPRTSEAAYVTFVPGSGCSSYVGFNNLAAQSIWLADTCSTGNAIHEIGHAVGLYHEHTREDRNTFVRVRYENIDPNRAFNFDQQITGASDIGGYDYGSIMHYGAYAFSTNGQPTIETIPAGIPIGQRNGLSAGDIAGARTLYGGSTTTGSVTVTVNSNPGGLTLQADGASFAASRSFSWTPGSAHTLAAPSQNAPGTQYVFSNWSNGGAQTQTYVTPASNASVTANYAVRYEVRASAGSGAGTVSQNPASADSYYAANTAVTVTATPAAGSCFVSWSGISAPANPVLSLTANQPYTLQANFQAGGVTATPAALSFANTAGSLTVSLSATSGCPWTARSNASWITVTPASGSGSGVLTVSVERNRGRSARSGTVTAGGATITVNQAGR